jgi:hypothetical protein
MNQKLARFNRSPHSRVRGTHNRTGRSMPRSPRRNSSGDLSGHRATHRRIDFQKDTIGAQVHQGGKCIGRTFFRRLIGKRAGIGGDGDDIGV